MTIDPSASRRDLLESLLDADHQDHKDAVEDLRLYFAKNTGGHFERLGLVNRVDPHPDTITATDIVAVSTLGVYIPASAMLQILGHSADQINDQLTLVPSRPLHEVPGALESDGEASKLWDLLMSIPGMGPTLTGKLMARKRPHLVPIHDQRVTYRLELPSNKEWAFWTEWWMTPDHQRGAEVLRSEVNRIDDISLLRVIDVAVWCHDVRLRPKLRGPSATKESIDDGEFV